MLAEKLPGLLPAEDLSFQSGCTDEKKKKKKNMLHNI